MRTTTAARRASSRRSQLRRRIARDGTTDDEVRRFQRFMLDAVRAWERVLAEMAWPPLAEHVPQLPRPEWKTPCVGWDGVEREAKG